MGNSLVVKNVNFCGAELLAVQRKEDGKIYAGVNSILRELGFNEKQIEYRRDKWRDDKVISKGVLKFSGTLVGAGTGKEAWCIDVMKLPLALAKIEVTPKMQEELPDLAGKLERYQDECADVLAEAFMPQKKQVKRKAIGKNDVAKFYTFTYGIAIVIGDEVYFADPDPKENIEGFISKLQEVGEGNIPNVLRAYLSVNNEKMRHFKSISGNAEYKPE